MNGIDLVVLFSTAIVRLFNYYATLHSNKKSIYTLAN